jgi:hypothetical protein
MIAHQTQASQSHGALTGLPIAGITAWQVFVASQILYVARLTTTVVRIRIVRIAAHAILLVAMVPVLLMRNRYGVAVAEAVYTIVFMRASA